MKCRRPQDQGFVCVLGTDDPQGGSLGKEVGVLVPEIWGMLHSVFLTDPQPSLAY